MTQVTMKAGQFRELLDTFSLPAGSERLFKVLPLSFTKEGIRCQVQSDEKTALLLGHFAPDPYVVEGESDDPVFCVAADIIPILSRFGQDDIINITIDGVMKFEGPGKEFTHYPESNVNVNIPATTPSFDEQGKMNTKAGPCTSFFTFDASAFHDMLEDAKVLDVDTYIINLGEQTHASLGSDEAKKDSGRTALKGHFDGEPVKFILGAELVYLMKNMKGDLSLQTLANNLICFTKKSTKPRGTAHILLAPKVVA